MVFCVYKRGCGNLLQGRTAGWDYPNQDGGRGGWFPSGGACGESTRELPERTDTLPDDSDPEDRDCYLGRWEVAGVWKRGGRGGERGEPHWFNVKTPQLTEPKTPKSGVRRASLYRR